jgi:ubiquitin-conjugating enzyme E2 variant
LWRLVTTLEILSWHLPLVALAGVLSADLASGLVHWAADTWGSEKLPFLGRRFLRPFRVHHVNPDDFLRRSFVDTNRDVSLLLIPILAGARWIPLESGPGPLMAVYVTSFAVASWPTNQVHQWAHRPAPPRLVAVLQKRGLLLSRAAHQEHHTPPHTTHYCIALGWLNGPLAALRVFATLDRLVRTLTGVSPRRDEASFSARIEKASLRLETLS